MRGYKKIISVILVCCLTLLMFSSCSFGDKEIINISGARVPKDVFTYFLDKAKSDAMEQLKEDADLKTAKVEGKPAAEWIENAAIQYCKEFVAVNSKFAELKLKLSTKSKNDISDSVEAQWRISSDYYKSIGLTKSTMTQIQQNKAYRDALFAKYYDVGGIETVPEQEIKNWYSQNYVAFCAIVGYLTETDFSGAQQPLTNAEKAALRKDFEMLATKINNGKSIYDVNEDYDKSSQSVETTVIKKTGSSYPQGFFDAVHQMDYKTAKVIEKGNYIYTVLRVNEYGDSDTLYLEHRTESLQACRKDDFNNMLAQWSKSYTVKRHNARIKKCEKILSIKS